MKRGFLNKPKAANGGPLLPGPASPLKSASSSSPLDVESLSQEFENLLRGQGLGDSIANTASFPQKLQNAHRGSSTSQAELEMAKLQDKVLDGGIKAAYGKVETVAIPEDYKSANNPIVPQDSKKTDHTAGVLLMTSIPSKTLVGPRDPDGHSVWMVLGPTKAKVVNSPGFPQPMPKPKASNGIEPAYVIKSTPDMGLGVFATRDIKMDELIFAERPLLVSPRSSVGVTVRNLEQYDVKTQMAIVMMEWEKLLGAAVGRMEPEDRKAFMELANSHREDGSGPILGIIRTNGFKVGGIYDGPKERADGNNAYSGVIKIGSRINHSCMPNVLIKFSTPSFSFQCTALVDIKAGEQLFYAYCGVEQSAAKRQLELAPYGIVCSCPACTHATPETDELRTEYRKMAMNYLGKLTGRQVAESAIEPVIRFKDALIREGFHYTREYKAMISLLQTLYERIGMKEKARPYKEEYKRYELTSVDMNGVRVFSTVPKY